MKTSLPRWLVIFMLAALVLSGCKMPRLVWDDPTPIPPPPTLPPVIADTPVPTDTLPPPPPPPPPTLEATPTETILFTVFVTDAPTWTPIPGVLVRIRNNTSQDVNLYRHGRSGEIHFLGWLVPTYYGEFRFPDFGEWLIRYCYRDKLGNSLNCFDKWINLKTERQEFSVP